jgi:hypothetical protein
MTTDIFATEPLRCSPYVTPSLTRRWVVSYEYAWALSSVRIAHIACFQKFILVHCIQVLILSHFSLYMYIYVYTHIQNIPRGKVNILGGHSIGHSTQKMYICTCVLFRTVSEMELFHCTVHCADEQHAMYLTRVAKCIDVAGGIFKKCVILGKLYQLCHLNNKYRYYNST